MDRTYPHTIDKIAVMEITTGKLSLVSEDNGIEGTQLDGYTLFDSLEQAERVYDELGGGLADTHKFVRVTLTIHAS
jgi:hypothetical protein